MYSLFFQPLYNGHFLLSPRWPLKRRSTVRIGGLIFVCSLLLCHPLSSSKKLTILATYVYVLSTAYPGIIHHAKKFESSYAESQGPNTLFIFFLSLLLFAFYTSLTYIVITYKVTWQNFRTNISLTVADPVKGPGPYF